MVCHAIQNMQKNAEITNFDPLSLKNWCVKNTYAVVIERSTEEKKFYSIELTENRPYT